MQEAKVCSFYNVEKFLSLGYFLTHTGTKYR